MKNKIKRLWVVLLAFVVLLFVSCDKKDPEPGYLNDDQVLSIVDSFSKTTDYTTYSYTGKLNFLGIEDDLVRHEVRGNDKEFVDSLGYYYSKNSTSYYLRTPLHLTLDNWTIDEEDIREAEEAEKTLDEATVKLLNKEITQEEFDEIEIACEAIMDEALEVNTTYHRIQSMLLTLGETLDKVYYYTDDEGNFYIKTFGANKALIIRESDIICHGKWNVTLKYNKDGYLVSEKFETINAHKDPDTKTCYGEATYTFA